LYNISISAKSEILLTLSHCEVEFTLEYLITAVHWTLHVVVTRHH
jgi:hypothetical protein